VEESYPERQDHGVVKKFFLCRELRLMKSIAVARVEASGEGDALGSRPAENLFRENAAAGWQSLGRRKDKAKITDGSDPQPKQVEPHSKQKLQALELGFMRQRIGKVPLNEAAGFPVLIG
jgi:hypothetical protein